jgi:uncharacterized protein
MRQLLAILIFLTTLTACTSTGTATPVNVPTLAQASPFTSSPSSLPPTAELSQATPSLQILPDSDWIGGIQHPDGSRESIILRMKGASKSLTIQPRTAALAVNDVLFDGNVLSFKTAGDDEMLFTGKLDADRITGLVDQGGIKSSFTLMPLMDETDDAVAEFSGVYRFESGDALYITLSPGYELDGLDYFWSGLTLTHFGTGAIRGLYPIAKDIFLLGSARVLGYPFEAQITFLRHPGGKVSGLLWQPRDPLTGDLGSGQSAIRLSVPSETVHYASADGTQLTGLLTLPDTPGPHPGIVVLHGSERGTRDDFGRQIMSAFMASQGLAVLTYDKRGVGDSGGTYQEAASESNLALLAQDALAGVEYLRGRPEVAGGRIGLIGYSQAGWIIPLAAGQSGDVAFFVNLSGPVVSVGIEEAYSAYTNNGDSPSQYSAQEISQKIALIPPSGFDPLPVIANLDQPGLWIWGDQDKSIPVPESINALQGLIAQGKSNFSYLLLPNADHNLQQTTQGLFTEIPYSSGYPPDFHTFLAQWLAENTK